MGSLPRTVAGATTATGSREGGIAMSTTPHTSVVSTGSTVRTPRRSNETMQATVFHGVDDIRVEEVPRPAPGPGEALLRVTLTTSAARTCIS
jgi:hypothetical protein